MALPGHVAPHGPERRRAEPVRFGAKQGGNDHIATRPEPAVRPQFDAMPKAVGHQHLLRLGQPQLPRRAGTLDAGQRRRARAAVVAGNEHVVGERLGHAGGHRPHPGLRHQLHAHPRPWIHGLEVVHLLREILDAVDVVMRRRRNEPNARGAVTKPGDEFRDHVTRQLAALAGLGPLHDLDLDCFGAHEILGGHAEARRRRLLDPAVVPIAVRRVIVRRVLTAFAGVRARLHAVHRDRQRFVCLRGQGAERHGRRNEPGADGLHRSDLFERNG